MAPAPVPKAFEGFARLGPNSYIYEPRKSEDPFKDQPSPPHPDVVLFMPWLNAQPKHIVKYTDFYKTIYPNATIILVTASTLEGLMRTKGNNIKYFSPVAAKLQSLPSNTRILLHSLSNGGLISAVLISKEYRRLTGAPLPIQAQILDSSPGYPHYWTTILAISAGLPKNPVIKAFGTAIIAVLYTISLAMWWATGGDNPVKENRALVNSGELFPKSLLRAYIYSREDSTVIWQDVESHIADSRKRGFEVRAELFEGTQHVSHMPKDSKRYWDIVQTVWKSSFGGK